MKINFDEKIKQHDARVHAIHQLSKALEAVDYHVQQIHRAIDCLDVVQSAYGALDDEGRKWLPTELQDALSQLASTRAHLQSALKEVKTSPVSRTSPAASFHAGMIVLAEQAEAE